MRQLFFALLMILSPHTLAQNAENIDQQAPAKPVPLDPSYMGIHGMVLSMAGSKLIASHLPLYHKPHDAQLIYRVTVDVPAVNYMVKDAELVTIKPERFNLQRLMHGESFTITADTYLGHFERGGMTTHPGIQVTFEEQLYYRPLTELAPSSSQRKYARIDLGGGAELLVHEIQAAPSFDHILLITDSVGCVLEFSTRTAVPPQGELINRLSFCGPMKPLHYETQDFQH